MKLKPDLDMREFLVWTTFFPMKREKFFFLSFSSSLLKAYFLYFRILFQVTLSVFLLFLVLHFSFQFPYPFFQPISTMTISSSLPFRIVQLHPQLHVDCCLFKEDDK